MRRGCSFGDSSDIAFGEADPPFANAKVERVVLWHAGAMRRRLNALLTPQTQLPRPDFIFPLQDVRRGAAADLLKKSSFARSPRHILLATVRPDCCQHRKCNMPRANFRRVVARRSLRC